MSIHEASLLEKPFTRKLGSRSYAALTARPEEPKEWRREIVGEK